ncbi:MAG: MauE/DoxX family redox-associated membrane protein, partial [Pyrinomonadaceae bacterium]
MKTFKLITKIIFGVLFIAAGVNHFVDPEFYLSIMPPYLPWHNGLVIISGIAEIVLGVGLLIPQVSRYAAWGLIVLLIAVFPANLQMASHPELYPTIPPLVIWLRLPLQGLLVADFCWIGAGSYTTK